MKMIHRKRVEKIGRKKNSRYSTKKWSDEDGKKGVINTEVSFEVVVE